jgi:hypothetical protein
VSAGTVELASLSAADTDPRDRERQLADIVAGLCAQHGDGTMAADALKAVVADSSAPVRAPLLLALSPDPGLGLQQLARRWASPILATLADAFSDGGRDLNVDYLNAVALATAVEHRAPTRLALKRIAHPRHGLPWDDDEDQMLLAAFQQGATVEALCEQHQRNANAIRARLVKHGAIEDDRPA